MTRWLAAPDTFKRPPAQLIDLLSLIRVARYAGVAAWEMAAAPVGFYDAYAFAMAVDQDMATIKVSEV